MYDFYNYITLKIIYSMYRIAVNLVQFSWSRTKQWRLPEGVCIWLGDSRADQTVTIHGGWSAGGLLPSSAVRIAVRTLPVLT